MGFSVQFFTLFGVLVTCVGCLDAKVERNPSPEVAASKVGLKVEWTQSPFRKAGTTGLSPGDLGLNEGTQLEFSVMRLSNETDESMDLHFGGVSPADTVLLGLEMTTGLTDEEGSRRVESSNAQRPIVDLELFKDLHLPLLRYESRWRFERLEVIRENGLRDAVSLKDTPLSEPVTERVNLRRRETIEVVAILKSSDPVLRSKARSAVPITPSAPAGSVFISPSALPENEEMAARFLTAATVDGTVEPTILLGGGRPLYLGDFLRTKKTYRTQCYDTCALPLVKMGWPVRYQPTMTRIPIFE